MIWAVSKWLKSTFKGSKIFVIMVSIWGELGWVARTTERTQAQTLVPSSIIKIEAARVHSLQVKMGRQAANSEIRVRVRIVSRTPYQRPLR